MHCTCIQLLLEFFGLAATLTQVIRAGFAMQNASRITINVFSAMAADPAARVVRWLSALTRKPVPCRASPIALGLGDGGKAGCLIVI